MYTKALAPVVLAAGMAWQAMAVTTDDHNYQLRCKPEMQGVVCGSLKPDTDYNSLSVEETYTSFNNGVHWSADLRSFGIDCLRDTVFSIKDKATGSYILTVAGSYYSGPDTCCHLIWHKDTTFQTNANYCRKDPNPLI